MTITVYGTPAPQGSKRHVGNGVMIESSKAVKPWREAVKWAVIDMRLSKDLGSVRGPICCEMSFTLKRPISAKAGAVPATRPDLSKLVRATEDALTDAGAWEDDGRVVSCVARKVFVGGVGALETPGAVITIQSAEVL